jgi:hypothetical protein
MSPTAKPREKYVLEYLSLHTMGINAANKGYWLETNKKNYEHSE